MSTLATGWQAVSYGHATFSVYNFVSADAEGQDSSAVTLEQHVAEQEPAANVPSASPLALSQAILACS